MPNPDAISLQAYQKDQVNYRQYEACKTCAYFNGRVYCKKVLGNVSANAVCDLWSLSEPQVGITGKETITKAYEESIGG